VEQVSKTSGRLTKPTGSGHAMSASLTPKEVFGILRRHILLIIFLTMLGLGAGGGTWYLLQKYYPRYTARTFIQVLSPVEKDPMTIGTVQLQKDVLYGYRQSIASLIKQQSTLEALIDKTNVQETKWFKRYAKFDEDGRILNKRQCMTKAYKYLKKYFGAYAHRDSEFVEISMTCGAAKEAADIVNEMLDLFLATRGTTEQREISDRLQGLEAQRVRVQGELDASNRGLDDIRETYGFYDLEMPTGRYFQHTITLRLNDLEIQKDELDLLIRQFRADIKNLQELATGPVTEQIEYAIESDPVMITLAQQLALQEAQLSGRLSKFGENHRDVRQAKELIEEIKQKRVNRKNEIANQTRLANLENAQDSLIVLQERFEQLEKLRQEAEAKKKELDIARIQYDKSLKIRDERIETLNAIKEQVEKLKIMHDDPETPKVLAVGRAPMPLEMVFSRQWWLWFPSGTVLGFLLSVGLTFLIELANDLVRTPSDVARFLRIPLLGIIPDASEDNQVRGIELSQAVSQAPYSIISESYRRCRTNLKLSGSSVKTLLVSSGMTGDGTTSMAVNLAMTLVAENKKVLLMDANFRQPDLLEIFPKVGAGETKVERYNFGLSSVLMHQCASQEAIRPSGIEGLDIIDSGPLPANPAELLGNPLMERLIGEQRKKYDNVIIDGPPVLLVSDSKVLARLVDATILVFNAAATSRGAAQRTIRELKEVDAKVIGCVLFAARAIKGGYFQEQFKSYRRYQKKAQKVRLAGSKA
jgi:capsular exopolysaccharide synthesis family protein